MTSNDLTDWHCWFEWTAIYSYIISVVHQKILNAMVDAVSGMSHIGIRHCPHLAKPPSAKRSTEQPPMWLGHARDRRVIPLLVWQETSKMLTNPHSFPLNFLKVQVAWRKWFTFLVSQFLPKSQLPWQCHSSIPCWRILIHQPLGLKTGGFAQAWYENTIWWWHLAMENASFMDNLWWCPSIKTYFPQPRRKKVYTV